MIKKPLIALVILVVAGVLGYAAAQHYTQYQNRKSAEAAKQAKAAETTKAQASKLQAENISLRDSTDSLRLNCAKGQTAYSKLPAATQKLIGAIDCGK